MIQAKATLDGQTFLKFFHRNKSCPAKVHLKLFDFFVCLINKGHDNHLLLDNNQTSPYWDWTQFGPTTTQQQLSTVALASRID